MPRLPNLDSYVVIVKRHSLRRKAIFAGKAVMETAWLEDDPQIILATADNYIQRLWAESEQIRSRAESGSAALSRILSFAAERRRKYEETGRPVMGISTGFARLDDLLGGLNPGLYLLGGGPGAGKTSFSLQLTVEACEQGFPVFYVTYENSRDSLILKAVCARAGVGPRCIERGIAHADDFQKV
jgi:replicative DNA helicase